MRTTALAAKRLGRNYIGFEKDKLYAEIAESKLAREEANSKIGDVWVSFFLSEAVTIRDIDWETLKENYFIPEPIEAIDHTAIKRRKSALPQTCVAAKSSNQITMPLFQKL